MADNVQPVRDNQQIRCMGLKSVVDQNKQRNLANKLPGQKGQKKKQNQVKKLKKVKKIYLVNNSILKYN